MSIKVMSAVWEHSQQSGGALLVLLALADFANDDGHCYPSVGTLADKSRMSRRNVQYILRDLEAAGEITAALDGGKNGTTGYIIMGGARFAPPQSSPWNGEDDPEGVKPTSQGVQVLQGGAQILHGGGRNLRQGGAQPIAPSPSLTVTTEVKAQKQDNDASARYPTAAAVAADKEPEQEAWEFVGPPAPPGGKWAPFYADVGELWQTDPMRQDGQGALAWAGRLAHFFGQAAYGDVTDARLLLASWAKSPDFRFAVQPTLAPPKAAHWLQANAAFLLAVER